MAVFFTFISACERNSDKPQQSEELISENRALEKIIDPIFEEKLLFTHNKPIKQGYANLIWSENNSSSVRPLNWLVITEDGLGYAYVDTVPSETNKGMSSSFNDSTSVINEENKKNKANNTIEQSYVYVTDKILGPYNEVSIPIFSPNSHNWAFTIVDQGNSGHLLYLPDGTTVDTNRQAYYITNFVMGIKGYQVKDIIFSKQGNRYAYQLKQQFTSGWQMVIDGNARPEQELVAQPSFSDDEKHFTYAAVSEGKVRVILDDKESELYDEVSQLHFSSASQRHVYLAKKGSKSYLVVNGEITPLNGEIGTFALSPDGKVFAYTQKKSGKWRINVNDKQGTLYDDVGMPVFNAVGSKLAHAFLLKNKWHITMNDITGPGYDAVSAPAFDTKTDKLVYAAKKGNKVIIVIDGLESDLFDNVGMPIYSLDGNAFAYLSQRDEKWHMVYNNKKSDIGYDQIDPKFLIHPNNIGTAYIAVQNNEYSVILCNKPIESYTFASSLHFDNDGKLLAFTAVKGNDTWHYVVDTEYYCSPHDSKS